MELTTLKEKFLALLETENFNQVQSRLKAVLFDCKKKEKMFDEWLAFCPDLSKDYMQIIYQYYFADRTKGKSQDFTPPSLAKLISELTKSENEKVVVDMCTGSGALAIQKWNSNKDLKFICLEFDETVIPLLLFNLAIRNIGGYVHHCDVLSGEVFATYQLEKGEKYATVSQIANGNLSEIKADSCISNPPYNIKWEIPALAKMQRRFQNYTLPPSSNANYAFALSALDYAEKAALIFPNSVLNAGEKELEIVEQLIKYNYIDAAIICPSNMFEATNIGVCVLLLNKHKTDAKIEFLDMREVHGTENREQRGQFGGKSHTNRVYVKEISIFTDENIRLILDCIAERKSVPEMAAGATADEVAEKSYVLSPTRYIDFVSREEVHRSYADILTDLNRCIEQKNSCKLVINETIAKNIGFDVELYKADRKDIDEDGMLEELTGIKVKKSDYITFTKRKNEVRFENNSAEEISEIFMLIFQMWKHNVYLLNREENKLLAELRDALLPDLMSGRVKT